MRARRVLLPFVAIAALAAGCGEDNAAGPGDAGADRAFAELMVPHHESAVDMAEVAAERAQSAFVKALAADITRTQTAEIATLKAEAKALAAAGVAAGDLGVPEDERGMDHDTTALRTAEPFDEAFLKMMVPHHEGAIAMAKAELERGADPELKALAEQIVESQEREIAEMQKHLGDAGAHDGH